MDVRTFASCGKLQWHTRLDSRMSTDLVFDKKTGRNSLIDRTTDVVAGSQQIVTIDEGYEGVELH